jgi:hypothetical protein
VHSFQTGRTTPAYQSSRFETIEITHAYRTREILSARYSNRQIQLQCRTVRDLSNAFVQLLVGYRVVWPGRFGLETCPDRTPHSLFISNGHVKSPAYRKFAAAYFV